MQELAARMSAAANSMGATIEQRYWGIAPSAGSQIRMPSHSKFLIPEGNQKSTLPFRRGAF